MNEYNHHFPRHLADDLLLSDMTGKKVYTSMALTVMTRQHIKKEWMTASYHNRIQKKWKRFGRLPDPKCTMSDHYILFHPVTLKVFADKIRATRRLFK